MPEGKREGNRNMKSGSEEKDKKAKTDFYDWFDSVESRLTPAKSTPASIDERKENA
jgi:hypothetical protein